MRNSLKIHYVIARCSRMEPPPVELHQHNSAGNNLCSKRYDAWIRYNREDTWKAVALIFAERVCAGTTAPSTRTDGDPESR